MRIRRLLTVAASALALILLASACDTSPTAATVGSQRIKQTALNAQLKPLAGDRAYVSFAQSRGVSVAGAAPNTFSSEWVASVLSQMVTASALSQYVNGHGRQPDAATLDAARGLGAGLWGDLWYGFTPSWRNLLTQAYADQAQIEPLPSDLTDVRAAFDQHRADFFTQVCVRVIAVSVTDANGNIDFSASLVKAQEAVELYNISHSVSGAGINGGTVTCYSQSDFEQQPLPFIQGVRSLAPGRAQQPQRTPYGYSVLAVDSRQSETLTPEVQAVINVGLVLSSNQADTALNQVLARTRIRINPQYGTWQEGSSTQGPGVVPPTGPPAGLVASTPPQSIGG